MKQEPVYDKTALNAFVQGLYDAKMREGKHGHYETLFHCVHQAIKRVAPTASPVQEPVAWGVFEGNLHDMFFTQKDAEDMARLKGNHAEVKPLYTTSPAAPVQESVGLIESLKDAQPCCGQYEICHRACTPRGKFLGHRDAQREWVGLTLEDKKEYLAGDFGGSRADAMDWTDKRLKEKNT